MPQAKTTPSPQIFTRIFLGVGANLTPDGYQTPQEGCLAAIASLEEDAITVIAVSPWYKSAPVPISDQPWFFNAVVEIKTALPPEDVIGILHHREARFGRIRAMRNEARVLDIDIIDFGGRVADGNLVLPHPRMHQRGFVLRPLADLAPNWSHPVTAIHIDDLINNIDPSQDVHLA